MLAALALNTHQLRRIRVIGEGAEHEETTPEEQDASAYFAPQRETRCPTEAHIQRRQNERGQEAHLYCEEDRHIGTRFTPAAWLAHALDQQRRILVVQPQNHGGHEG